MDILSNLSKKEENLLIKYGLFILFFNILTYTIVLLIGKIFDELYFTIIFMILYSPIRILIGGYHCKKAHTCLLMFSLIITFIILLYKAKFKCYLFLICLPIYLCNMFKHKKNSITIKTILIIIFLAIEFRMCFCKNIFSLASSYSINLTIFLYIFGTYFKNNY